MKQDIYVTTTSSSHLAPIRSLQVVIEEENEFYLMNFVYEVAEAEGVIRTVCKQDPISSVDHKHKLCAYVCMYIIL